MYNNSLTHFGIKGMKWGRRKSSGSSIGNISDTDMRTKVKRLKLEQEYKTLSKDRTSINKMDKTKKLVDATSTLVNQGKTIANKPSNNKPKVDLSTMTEKELRDKINRASLERQYASLFEDNSVPKGKQYAGRLLEGAGTALAITSSALGVALAIKELRG